MKQKRLTIPLALVLVMTMAAFTCSHKAATTSRGVAASLVALQDAEINLHTQGTITDSEHRVLQGGFLTLAQAGIQVNKCIGAGGGAPCVDTAINAVNIFISSPVAGIKNPDSKKAITLAAEALITSLNILKGAL